MRAERRVLVGSLVVALISLVCVGLVAQAPSGLSRSRRMAREAAGERKVQAITAVQQARVRDRVALAIRIIQKHQAEADAQGLSGDWRRAQLEALLPLSLAALQEVERAPDLESLAQAIALEVADPQSIGNAGEDLVYTPTIPCRYIDTRAVGGRISGYRGYDLANNGSAYGGNAACAPATLFGVTNQNYGALVLNVTAVAPTAPGWLAIKPYTAAPTSSLVNWYQAGPEVQAANQAIVTTMRNSAEFEFYIQASAPVHVVADLFGAFLTPEATRLDCVTNQQTGTAVPGSALFISSSCPTGYSPTGGGWWTDATSDVLAQMQFESYPSVTGLGWTVTPHNRSSRSVEVTVHARCCRIPGR